MNTNKTPTTNLQVCKTGKKKKTKTPRCQHLECNKKIKHYMGKCKCEKLFCSKHRLPHQHKCDEDYKINKLEFIKTNGLGGGKFRQVEAI